MAKYFSGITLNENKYTISILDDNLNIIFMDTLEIDRLVELLKRKSISVISIDVPVTLYLKHTPSPDTQSTDVIRLKRRSFDNMVNSKNLFTYQDRFNVNRSMFEAATTLYRQLTKLGFSMKKSGEIEKTIIESYPDTSFMAWEGTAGSNRNEDEEIRKKIDLLRSKGIRLKDYFKRNTKSVNSSLNTLCQAYTSFLYYMNESTCLGALEEGIMVIPVKDIFNKIKPVIEQPKIIKGNIEQESRNIRQVMPANKPKNYSIAVEYCGAQYLYTNTDGVIRINDLRPIKSYRPFTEIYEMKFIKQVQVIINTTDGLRKVKANLIPNSENSNCFKAADDEDKKKLDNFWGNHGDKRGYMIKFNKVELIKA